MADTEAPAQPLLQRLPSLLRDAPVLADLMGAAVVAVPEGPRAFFLAGLTRLSDRRPVIVATPTTAEAERLVHDLRNFLGPGAVELFPAWETLPFERVSPATETMGRRLRVMWRLRVGFSEGPDSAPDQLPRIVVAPVRALVQRLGPHVEDVEPVVVRRGGTLDQDDLVQRLVAMGYRREYQVEARGEIAVRGSIVDVYPSTEDHPVRIDLWGDEVDRMQRFSISDQRATSDLDEEWVFPCRELLFTQDVRSRAQELIATESWAKETWERIAEGLTFDGMESWLPWLTADEHLLTDLVPAGGLVILTEPRRMRDRSRDLLDEESSLASTLAVTWGADPNRSFPRLSLEFDRLLAHTSARTMTMLGTPDGPSTPHLAATGFDPVAGDPTALASRLSALASEGYSVTLVAEGSASAQRLAQVLADEGLSVPVADAARDATDTAGIHIAVGSIESGFVLPAARVAVVTESQVTGRRRTRRKPRGARRGEDYYHDLALGDLVVHASHGVGRYAGMVTRAIGGVERDYLLLEYRGGDKLYVPTDQVGSVRRYTGGDSPSIHRLGGADWERAKSRVRNAVREIAQELVVLYRERTTAPGHAFASDTPWQHEVEEAFGYEETPDQQRAIDEVKADMERPIPMDRLVCGDVGYGKTEIAVRAAFKAVQDGKQVAVLVPTTLLAGQHGDTFRDRFANYPVRVEVLSRFLAAKEQASVMAGLADGSVDVVIGTHRLLSGDAVFKDLGLLVVDEEQRFGVSHKERIKQLRANVDVLTLSATPIPRTLEMSLTGIRDLSLVSTPPEDRRPVLTYVGEYDERAAGEAIRRELLREGQVFFVHNRVVDIEEVAQHVRGLAPEARVVVAHGQMDEAQLERAVIDFAERRYDVLVCTTIIESGIDMPTVNTLVVDRSDLLGLAQLYQLRGRVGRSAQRAYAYLFWPADRSLTDDAYERLKTIGEHTELGSGFKIAMRDLEIRGAGNLLGGEQSGHIAAVGFDLYCEMVTEAVRELKLEGGGGEETEGGGRYGALQPAGIAAITIDIPLDAHIPRDYISRDDLRMEAYRRLAAAIRVSDSDDIREEWVDRYGPPPDPARALLAVARLRAECVRLGVTEVSVQRGTLRLAPLALRESQKVRLARLVPGALIKENDVVLAPVDALDAAGAGGASIVDDILALLLELVPAEMAAGRSDS